MELIEQNARISPALRHLGKPFALAPKDREVLVSLRKRMALWASENAHEHEPRSEPQRRPARDPWTERLSWRGGIGSIWHTTLHAAERHWPSTRLSGSASGRLAAWGLLERRGFGGFGTHYADLSAPMALGCLWGRPHPPDRLAIAHLGTRATCSGGPPESPLRVCSQLWRRPQRTSVASWYSQGHSLRSPSWPHSGGSHPASAGGPSHLPHYPLSPLVYISLRSAEANHG